MTNRKSTRRALMMSCISLLLCISMLVGTTFAWFTDEVKSGTNQILAGNLDVDVLTADGNSIEGVETLFNGADGKAIKWEPGVVAYENLTVVNNGTLALKYQLSVNFDNATKTPEGKTLAEVLKVAVVDKGVAAGLTREQLLASIADGQWQDLASFVESGKLLPENYNGPDVTDADKVSKTYGIVIYWQPGDNDNDYNMNNENQGKVELSIDLGINLVATQLVAEDDSFDNTYDEGAWVETMLVSTEAELETALNAAVGKNVLITLENDIVLTDTWTPIGDKDAGEYFTGTLDGNGHTISGLNVGAHDYDALISAAKDATIKNLTVEGTVDGVNAAGIVARVEGETVIENCVSNVTVTGTAKAGGIVCNVTNSGKTVIANCVNNGDVNGGDAGIGGLVGYVNNNAYLEIINCTNTGDVTSDNNKYAGAAVGYVNFNCIGGLVAGMTNTGAITGTVLADGRYLKDGETVILGYCNPANWTIAKTINNADELVALGGKSLEGVYVLTADIDLGGADMATIGAAYGKSLTIICNGYTISNAELSHTNHNGMKHYGLFYAYTNSTLTISDLTVENVNMDCTNDTERNYGVGVIVCYADGGSTVSLNNVDVHNCTLVNNKVDIGDEAGVYVGYQTGTLTMVRCDSTGCSVAGETVEKTGAFIGMVNGTATLTNCTTDLTIGACNRISGTLIIDGSEVITDNAGLKAALNSGADTIVLGSGEYTMVSTSGDVTIKGSSNTKITLPYGSLSGSGNTITFEGITVYGETNSSWYSTLFNGAEKVVYKDCVIYDQLTTYCDSAFIGCTFYNTFANDYSVYCYSGKNISFEGCTFNTECGKAIKVYDEGNGGRTVTVTGCTFIAENYKKAAVEIDSTFSTYYVYINDCKLEGAFTALWNSDAGEDVHTNVCVDGTWVKGTAPASN